MHINNCDFPDNHIHLLCDLFCGHLSCIFHSTIVNRLRPWQLIVRLKVALFLISILRVTSLSILI